MWEPIEGKDNRKSGIPNAELLDTGYKTTISVGVKDELKNFSEELEQYKITLQIWEKKKRLAMRKSKEGDDHLD